MTNKPLDYYLALPYKVDIYPEPDGTGYTALVPDLPGCITSADTIEDLWRMVAEAKTAWLELATEDGDHIPEPPPVEEEEHSGKFVVRLPRSLHRELAGRAGREGTSLNQLVMMLLSDGMGRWHEPREGVREHARFFTDYNVATFRQLSSISSQVLNLLVMSHSEPTKPGWSWRTEDLEIHKSDSIRVLAIQNE